MEDTEFDQALIRSAFALAGEKGWPAASIAEAARRADLSLSKARERFPNRAALLLKFGRMADQTALAETPKEGTVRDRLFYLIMQRLDVLQTHRAGILALMRALPTQPDTAALLACATRRSMRWLLEAAGVSSRGLRGDIRTSGLLAIWLWALRAWQADETADLSQTMSAVDNALQRAERFAGWLGGAEVPSPPPSEQVSVSEIVQGEPPEPESPPPPAPGPEAPPTSLPPEPLA
ncbi:MAG: TetR family transcriptional regulator [Acetobacteraceae bacterium]|nr:TetR family transcriptional regulator [Acetobacteraceae bacterium]